MTNTQNKKQFLKQITTYILMSPDYVKQNSQSLSVMYWGRQVRHLSLSLNDIDYKNISILKWQLKSGEILFFKYLALSMYQKPCWKGIIKIQSII